MSVAGTFDAAAVAYEQQLSQGISLSGESADYFVRGRVKWFGQAVRKFAIEYPNSVLDFGCGVGNAATALLEEFAGANVTGVDCSKESLSVANSRYEKTQFASQLRWLTSNQFSELGSIDVAYTSGVFHHILPEARQAELSQIRTWLKPGGLFALFENNPWNPGTRWVMSRIPFDRDAICLSPIEARGRLRDAGFQVLQTNYLFFFPRLLSSLRFSERALRNFPLGAQYVVLARKS